MPNDKDPGPRPTIPRRSRRVLLTGLLLTLAVVGSIVVVVTRSDMLDGPATSTISPTTDSLAPPPATKGPDSSTEVVTRLQEILRVRERAFRDRNPALFEEIYSSDCPCLPAGRNAIAALKREHIIWRERSILVQIKSARKISDRLWEVMAVFRSEPFRIETEKGELVREAPAERLRYRFLLVRALDTKTWQLGSASLVEGA
jgi:hypothetical protein